MKELDDILQHYGVKGMRWGVRRDLKKLSPGKAREDYIKSYDKKWTDKVNKNPKATKVASMAAKEAKKMTKELNNQYKEQGYSFGKNSLRSNNINNKRNKLAKTRYESEVKGILEASLDKASYKVYGNSPSGFSQVNIKRNADGTLYAEIGPRSNAKLTKQQISLTKYDQRQAKKQAKTVKHSAEEMPDYDGVVWIIKEDADGFYEDFEVVQDLTQSGLDEVLQHYGIKGMRWGVRREVGADGRIRTTGPTTIKEKLGSLKRERDWKKVLKEMDNMTVDEIKTVTSRIGLENELKRLSKTTIASKKDKQDYVRRGDMDNEELSNKVTNLKAKESLSKAVTSASKEQVEFGKKVVDVGGALTLKYATTKSLTPQDVFDAVKNPKPIKDKAVQQLVDTAIKQASK